MNSPRQGRSWYAAWLGIVAVGALSFWLAQTWLRPQRVLAARVAVQLETTPAIDLSSRMRELAAFGEDALPHLVAALKHSRHDIAAEARAVLSEELDRWQLLPPRAASLRLAILSRELARGIEGCSPTTRRLASDLATRILLWPVDAAAVDQQQLIADCERVLLATRQRDDREVASAALAGANFSPMALTELSPLDEELSLPGGGLPHEMTRVPSLPPEERSRPRTLPVDETPELTPILRPVDEPRPFVPDAAARERPIDDARLVSADDTFSQIARLVSNNVDEREAAETSLRRIGFRETHLAVARKFADPNPAVRRKLVEMLARQEVVDGRPWLLRLLADRDRTVRLSAASVLATSSDPALLQDLRRLAIGESDPDVRAVLEKATQE